MPEKCQTLTTITDEELRIMKSYCGGDPRIPCNTSEIVFEQWGSEEWKLSDFLEQIHEAVAKIPEEFRPIALAELEGGYDEGVRLTISYARAETEDEIRERVSRALTYARETLRKERTTYNLLRQKYGDARD